MKRYLLATVALASIGAFALAPLAAHADPFQDLASSGAGPGNYAVLGLGGGTVTIGKSTEPPGGAIVTGNVGIGSGGSIVNYGASGNQGNNTINGNVVESTAGQYQNAGGALTGSIIVAPSTLATNVTGANQAATDAAGLSATTLTTTLNGQTTTGKVTGFTLGETISGQAGINVINLVDGFAFSASSSQAHSVTFTGPSDAEFVINDPGRLNSLDESASFLTSGISPTNVLFNFTNPSAQLNVLGGGDVIDGILLSAGTGSHLGLPTTNLGWVLNGEAIGQDITVLPDAFVTDPDAVPEPGSLALLGTALIGLGIVGWTVKKRRLA